jgi:FlaA1/EpsC-like NDP-sugar epimerase
MTFYEKVTDSLGQWIDRHPKTLQLTLTAVAASVITASSILSYQSSQRRSRARTLKDELNTLGDSIDLTPLGTVYSQTLPPAVFDDALINEQLSKNTALLGEAGTQNIRNSFVIVVGAGGVGSWAALMLLRSGVQRIRVIDFDQVTLSSLNRHAVATLGDVGTPKVRCIKTHFKEIAPFVEVEDCVDLLNADNVDTLLGGKRKRERE